MFKTTRGLILREVDYKEADKILTVLTEDEGKKTIKARGARRTKSKLAAASQFLTFSDMTIFVHKDMWTINEAVAVEQFGGLRSDIVSLALASYFAEVLEAVTDEDYPDPAVLHLGLNSLYALSEGLHPEKLVKAAFELRLMCLSGYEPDLSACTACGGTELDSVYIKPESCEILCGDCRDEMSVEVSCAVLRAMRHIISAEAKKIFSFELDGESLKQLSSICEKYLLNQLDRPFGSLDYYKKMSR
ncbi:MAG: DNA repair protein RecO [Clostridia bacterium]|nr:DNA repair protein RecO [Clostridia bacterium]NCC68787.1 DNA repair protein RecO [Clostridia bacterium]